MEKKKKKTALEISNEIGFYGVEQTELLPIAPDTKIKYTFHNNIGETVEMTFTMIQIEGMEGGFIKHIIKELDEMGFGNPVEIYRVFNA